MKALRIIAAGYLPLFDVPPMPDAKQVVENVLSGNEFLLSNPETGQLEPASVDSVVSVATSRLVEEDLKWGAGCLLNVMDALRRRAQSEGCETYLARWVWLLFGSARLQKSSPCPGFGVVEHL